MTTENNVLNTRYRLDKKIGQGGFAQVFLATDLILERRVALKILNPELLDEATFLERFGKEARAIAALDHPNILAVYDYGQAEQTAYLVMPYVEGGTLHDRLRRDQKISLPQAGQYLQQVAAALDYAHRRNIVHRDIKPQNMLLRAEDDRLLLADFGIAKVLSSASAQSRTGAMGTLSYMSPEQLNGHVSRATDIYALGCVLFLMLTGQLPYTGPTEQVLMGHLTAPVPSIVERSSGTLPQALQAIIDRALAKRPEDRFQSAGELSNAFHEVVSSSGRFGVGSDGTSEAEQTQVLPPVWPSRPYTSTLPGNGIAPGGNTAPASPAPSAYETQVAMPAAVPPAGSGGTLPPPYPGPTVPPPAPALPVGQAARPPRPGLVPAWLILTGGVAALIVIGGIVALTLLPGRNSTSTPAAQTPVEAIVTKPTQTGGPDPSTASATAVSISPALPATTAPPATTTAPPPSNTPAPSTTTASSTVRPAGSGPLAVQFDRATVQTALGQLPGIVSAYVIMPDGQTVGANPERAVPAASTIKLWIAATLYEEAQARNINLSESYVVAPTDNAAGTGILRDKVGTRLTVEEVVNTMLIYSDNAAANILIGKLGGFDKINRYAERNGYSQTRLQRRLGDVGNPNNNFTSARDSAVFMQKLYRGEIVDKTTSSRILKALDDRRRYPDDQDFFGTNLPGRLYYLHISGTGTRIRNEVGYFPVGLDPLSLKEEMAVVAIYTSEVPVEPAAEKSISQAVLVVSQSVTKITRT